MEALWGSGAGGMKPAALNYSLGSAERKRWALVEVAEAETMCTPQIMD